MIIEGKNAVNEALKSNITIEKLMVSKAVSGSMAFIINECKDRKIPVQFVEKPALDRLSETGGHQGIIAVCTEFEYCEVDDIVQKKDKPLLIILLDGIEDPHNMGAIIRVADSVGADGIIIPRRRCCGVTDTAVKVSSGAAAHVKIAKVNNLNDTIRDLKAQNIFVFAADMGGQDVYSADLTCDAAFVVGGEGGGVHRLTKELSDAVLALPQLGKINSLNAGVAAGVILYECVRQRLGKGII